MRGRSAINFDELIQIIENWLQHESEDKELVGSHFPPPILHRD